MGARESAFLGRIEGTAILERAGLLGVQTSTVAKRWWPAFRRRCPRLGIGAVGFEALFSELISEDNVAAAGAGGRSNAGVDSEMLHRAFRSLDTAGRGVIDGIELFCALALLSRGSMEEKALLLIALVDLQGRGRLGLDAVGMLIERTSTAIEKSCVSSPLRVTKQLPRAMAARAFAGSGAAHGEMSIAQLSHWWKYEGLVRRCLHLFVMDDSESEGLPVASKWRWDYYPELHEKEELPKCFKSHSREQNLVVASADYVSWSGDYEDPKHPGCKRHIKTDGLNLTICGEEEDLTSWTVDAQLEVHGAMQVTVDFSSRGGPRAHLMKWVDQDILFPDGSRWQRIVSPALLAKASTSWPGRYTDPNHPGCPREIQVEGLSLLIDGKDEDDMPWRAVAKLNVEDAESGFFDFSCKGGPRVIRATLQNDRIDFQDGNSWQRISSPQGPKTIWPGQYADPNHPECKRAIRLEGLQIIIEGSDEDQVDWTLQATLESADATQVTLDFSSKGGPAALLATLESDGIRFPDGDKWQRLAALAWSGQYADPNHPGCKRAIRTEGLHIIVEGVDEDQVDWTLQATLESADATQVTLDFSSKGGPAALLATLESDGIRFPDGSKWQKC
eukprot:TRINITY_DN4357_c0_g1_i1.p1 TRINITY_DN4357_c0_g1~~TRINITY_DN4357_c0_g1_i1.p1  ORF type:complete len:617 (-),score=103.42 TRINITY_DN4357_c0_g1_i1:210-2060(-)